MTRTLYSTLLFAASLFVAKAVMAHGDTEKPLFVSVDGQDNGLCTDSQAPCRSISHALALAGKGSQIRVAAGTYPVENTEDLFHIVSGVMEVTGGYAPGDDFSLPGSGTSTLTGVPIEFRDMLRSRGFHVIADRKGIDGPEAAKALAMLDVHEQLKSSQPATPCVNGNAGNLACSNMDLLAHVAHADVSASPSSSNDVWGFSDLNTGREYVIAGFNIGTAVFDVTDPEQPREIGFIDGQNASWRDIKVLQTYDAAEERWKAYAYVTTDGSSDGLFVIDMTGLPQSISRAGYASDYSSAHNVYSASVDFATGIPLAGANPTLVIAGSNISGGQYRSYSLANPAAPAFIGGAPSAADYMHDAASMRITDSRKDTQCVNAVDVCEILFDFNESTVDIWDISVPSNPQRLSRTPYPGSGYTHSGWPTEDGMFVFFHDELDEQRSSSLNTTVRVMSLANLATPAINGSWTGTTRAIDHNGFVRGNRYYMSNYSRGLTVLDISNPTIPVEVGSMDTYPFGDPAGFVGAWGAYPYLHSRVVAISDINSGLYLVADRTLDVAQGSVGFESATYGASEGTQAALVVQRSGGSSGAISVDYELVPATAEPGDYQAISGTISWSAADTADKTIAVNVVQDGVNESLERVLVNLVNPTGGATLGENATASLYINDAGAAAEISLIDPVIDVAERGFATAVVVAQRSGNANGAASVDFAVSAGDATSPGDYTGTSGGTLDWANGDGDAKWIEFAIVDDGINESTEFFELTFSNPVGASLVGPSVVRVNIENGSGVNQSPRAVAGASQSVTAGTVVTLNGSASNDPDGDALSFEWSQTSGPQVALSNANTSSATFTAPTVQSDTMLQFRLTVRDPAGLSNIATTAVVINTGNAGGGSGGSSGGGALGLLLLLLLAGIRLPRIALNRTGGGG
jgi:choice-of-anchor B domain-containing protein